jgi:hypothetical protein
VAFQIAFQGLRAGAYLKVIEDQGDGGNAKNQIHGKA